MSNTIQTSTRSNRLDVVLLILRLGVGTLMLTHGIPKLQMLFSGEEIQFPGVMGLSPSISLALAVFAEVLCSLFILIGLKTRLAAIPLVVTMLVAVLLVHQNDPFASQELGLLYLFLYLPLLILGSGKFSLDQLVGMTRKSLIGKGAI